MRLARIHWFVIVLALSVFAFFFLVDHFGARVADSSPWKVVWRIFWAIDWAELARETRQFLRDIFFR